MTVDVSDTDRPPSIRFYGTRWIPLTVLVAGILLTAVTFVLTRNSEHKQAGTDFRLVAAEHLHGLKSAIQANLYALETVGAFFNSSDSVYRSEFKSFAAPLLEHHPEINIIGWVPHLRAEDRRRCELAARQDGIAGFEIVEKGRDAKLVRAASRQKYFPIYYAEPQEANIEVLGFDLASDTSFLDAVGWLEDLWMISASDKLPLDVQTGGRTGLTIFQPIFDTGGSARSTHDRLDRLQGLVSVTYSIDEIMQSSIAPDSVRQFDLCMYDLSASSEPQLIYPAVLPPEGKLPGRISIWANTTDIALNEVYSIADRIFLVKYMPTPAFWSNQPPGRAYIIIVVGIILSLIGAGLTFLILRQSSRSRRYCLALRTTTEKLKEDIENRRRIEGALRSSEELYRTTIDAVDDMIFVVDRELKFSLINTAFARRLRNLPETQTILGRSITDLLPFLPEEILDEYRRVFDGAGMMVAENTTDVGGHKIITEAVKVPLLEDSEVVWVVTIVRDITQRKRREELLKKVLFADSIQTEAVFGLDFEGRILFTSQTARTLLGYSDDELGGKNIYDIDEGLTVIQWSLHRSDLEKTGSVNYGSTYRTRDGRLLPVEVEINTLEIDGEKYIYAVMKLLTTLQQNSNPSAPIENQQQ